jgi:hypothetical protein
METFDFFVDTKVTDWYRTHFEIKAKSLKEAKKMAIKYVKEGKNVNEDSWEKIDNAERVMSVKENNGQPTEELHTDDFDTIWDNTQQ